MEERCETHKDDRYFGSKAVSWKSPVQETSDVEKRRKFISMRTILCISFAIGSVLLFIGLIALDEMWPKAWISSWGLINIVGFPTILPIKIVGALSDIFIWPDSIPDVAVVLFFVPTLCFWGAVGWAIGYAVEKKTVGNWMSSRAGRFVWYGVSLIFAALLILVGWESSRRAFSTKWHIPHWGINTPLLALSCIIPLSWSIIGLKLRPRPWRVIVILGVLACVIMVGLFTFDYCNALVECGTWYQRGLPAKWEY
jgi:hypothetical protein